MATAGRASRGVIGGLGQAGGGCCGAGRVGGRRCDPGRRRLPRPAARGTPSGAEALRALYGAPHREDGVVIAGAHAGAQWIKWTKPDGNIELSAAHGMFADTGKYRAEG